MHSGKSEIQMQKSTAVFGMVSHHQAPSATDFSGLSFSVYSGKSHSCVKRAGSDSCGADPSRSPHDNASHVQQQVSSPKRLPAPVERYPDLKNQTEHLSQDSVQGTPDERTYEAQQSIGPRAPSVNKVQLDIQYLFWPLTRSHPYSTSTHAADLKHVDPETSNPCDSSPVIFKKEACLNRTSVKHRTDAQGKCNVRLIKSKPELRCICAATFAKTNSRVELSVRDTEGETRKRSVSSTKVSVPQEGEGLSVFGKQLVFFAESGFGCGEIFFPDRNPSHCFAH
ncbi:hypothetical protein SKAU_G00204530 [Synaphobranchus kaupii]|uniref:Uncharacterized protein n=1 Tax=Synaphobranchus kaupii TaxID=118154 RepID=A0A9Q1FG62_SYNKA|nr:hypothetical protein SKAU_G00204530 [Synaphobranchus kaupii]